MTEQLAPTAGWCPPGGCPSWTQERADLAYEAGYQRALTLAAERVDELDAIWRPVPRPTYEAKVAERIAALPGRTPPPALRFDDPDWPPVTVPGAGGMRLGPGVVIAPDNLISERAA